jgi:hypothetical protein
MHTVNPEGGVQSGRRLTSCSGARNLQIGLADTQPAGQWRLLHDIERVEIGHRHRIPLSV